MQRTASSLIGLLCASSSFAGAYIGASIGPEGATFNQTAHVQNQNIEVIDREHYSGFGVFGSLFAGYGSVVRDHYYVAAEVNANLSSLQYKLVNDEYLHSSFSKTTFTMNNSEGISLLPGYLLSPGTLAYLRVGYSNAHLKISESDPSINSSNHRVNGVRYGLGLRHQLNKSWAVMMDYSQVNYDSVRGVTYDPFGKTLKDTKIAPITAQLGVGVIYQMA